MANGPNIFQTLLVFFIYLRMLTADARVGRLEVHFEVGVARFDAVEVLVVDAQGAPCPAGALPADSVYDVRETSEVARVSHHRLEAGLLLDAPTQLHPTVARPHHDDDVISGTARLESFTGAMLGHVVSCELLTAGRRASPLQYR